MTVLITGAGLIATHAAKALSDRREKIVFYDVAPSAAYIDLVMQGGNYTIERGDILDMANLMAVIKRHDIKGVVHTAAFLPERARANPSLCTRVNVEGAVNVFEAHRLAGAVIGHRGAVIPRDAMPAPAARPPGPIAPHGLHQHHRGL